MNVFLVDDEYLQRELVKKIVDWEKLDMQVSGEAEDGEEALEKVMKEKPDVLIMDINIPYINGIEVSRRVKEALPDIQIIILTAYGEFEYAKQALSLGAVSFVLKPVDPRELEQELMKCRGKLEQVRAREAAVNKMREKISQKEKEQFLLEQFSGIVAPEKEETIWRKLGRTPSEAMALLIVKFRDKHQTAEQSAEIEKTIWEYFPENERLEVNRDYVFLIFGKEQMEYQLQLLCAYLNETVNAGGKLLGGASRVHGRVCELREAYQEAYAACQRGAQRQICIFEPLNMTAFLQSAAYEPETLIRQLRKREYDVFLKTVSSYFQEMERANALPREAGYVAVDILIHFSLYMTELGIDFFTETEAEQQSLFRLQENGSVRAIAQQLLWLLETGRSLIEKHKIPATKRKAQDAKTFIDQNYNRFDMSLIMVAEAIGVNASYLSNIFKKECGCSLSKYLNSVRLEQARKQTKEFPEKTLIEISEAVGYADVYYFSKNFKACYGVTPSKYQEEQR
ncbi:MAG: response regulator [Eubacteriales bacterium]|nr:response regulator [Eubacteriales bacterium]